MVTVSGWCRTAYQDQCPTITARDENVCEYSVRVAKREVRIWAGSQVLSPRDEIDYQRTQGVSFRVIPQVGGVGKGMKLQRSNIGHKQTLLKIYLFNK